MNILILEDSEERTIKFYDNLCKHSVFVLATPHSVIEMLSKFSWDALFLDHDLEGKALCPSDEKSGYAVACWLEEHPEHKPRIIVVHSLNPLGIRRIKQALPEAIVCPFVWSNKLVLEKILKN